MVGEFPGGGRTDAEGDACKMAIQQHVMPPSASQSPDPGGMRAGACHASRPVSSPGRSQPACSFASNSPSRSSDSRTPRSMSEATIPSRSSTDWKLETERSRVLPSRS